MRNINLPKSRVYVRKDAFGGNPAEFQPAWLVGARAMRNRPLCFQVWVDEFAACFDKIPPHCLYWFDPDYLNKTDFLPPLPLHKAQMWECLTGSIELWQKQQLADVPVLVNLGRDCGCISGHYWFTIDFLPEAQHLGMIDVGDAELLEEHKEGNVIKLENGQIAIYPNNRIKWLPVSLTPKGAAEKIPQWDVATNEQWDEWWSDSAEILGDSKWAY
jgi:hypothetical protein